MISRLTAIAASVAFVLAASLGFAASAHQTAHQSAAPGAASAKPMRVLQLPTVVVVGKRIAHDAI